MFFSKKTTKNSINQETFYGFSFPEEPVKFSSRPAVLCLLKSLLVFCASFGTLGGLLSAFSVNYNVLLVMGLLLIISFILGFLHYNSFIFNTVYPLIFVIFTYSIIKCRIIANSGFQTFVSVLFEEYSSYFELALIREVTVDYSNQYLAITVAAIFVGFFLALLLNIAISSYMSLPLTLLLTFPFLQLAIYIEKYPSPFYLFLILFSYVTIGILKRSKHFDLPLKNKKRVLFQIKKKKEKNATYTLHNYKSNGPILFQIAGLFAVISTIFMLVSYSLLVNHNAQQSVSNSLKAKTDEYVKIFVQTGLSGFFNRYEAKGGISGGQLGGVSSVRPDYQPDLKVTFAPYSYNTIYLKAFTGADYTGSEWLAPFHRDTSIRELFGVHYQDFLEYCVSIEANRLAYSFENSANNLKAKMKIENLDAASEYLYLPYYTSTISKDYSVDQGIYSGSLAVGETLEVSYYPPEYSGLLTGSFSEKDIPNVPSSFPLGATEEEKSYYDVYNMNSQIYYKSIPTKLEPTLEKIKDEIGTVETLEDQILLIQDYFTENYPYSTTPGTTPMNADFVDYFLNTQKKGYCAHFASAATLLFRSYGYPARYVEGYVITFQDMSNALAVSENYDDYLQGENPLGKTGVVEVNVTDGNAHAWVEVYKEGFGWIPVEVTPPSSEGDSTYSDFWDVFSGLFSVSGSQNAGTITATEGADNNQNILDSFLSSTDIVAGPLLLLLSCLILVPILTSWIRKWIALLTIQVAFSKGNYGPMVSYYYNKLLTKLRKKKMLAEANPSPEKIKTLLFTLFLESDNMEQNQEQVAVKAMVNDYIRLLERGCFSKDGISKSEVVTFKKITNILIRKRIG